MAAQKTARQKRSRAQEEGAASPAPRQPARTKARNTLIDKMHDVLAAQDQGAKERAPMTLHRLVELARTAAADETGADKTATLAGIARSARFRERMSVLCGGEDAPVVLREDLQRAMDSGEVLLHALRRARAGRAAGASALFSVSSLREQLPKALHSLFDKAMTADAALAPGCCWVMGSGRRQPDRKFFLEEDLHREGKAAIEPAQGPGASLAKTAGAAPGQAAGAAQGMDFEHAFNEAFARLDRAEGSNNFVSLVDLRRAVPVSREVFDTELFKLRQQRRYSLIAYEGRQSITPEQRDAAIAEQGAMMLHVVKRA